jgi:SOS-response transcriptional repressor LexA
MITLTDKQKDLLKEIYDFREKNGYPPTLEELSKKLNKTKKAIADQLKLIEKKGYIKIIPRIARGIVIYESKIKEII